MSNNQQKRVRNYNWLLGEYHRARSREAGKTLDPGCVVKMDLRSKVLMMYVGKVHVANVYENSQVEVYAHWRLTNHRMWTYFQCRRIMHKKRHVIVDRYVGKNEAVLADKPFTVDLIAGRIIKGTAQPTKVKDRAKAGAWRTNITSIKREFRVRALMGEWSKEKLDECVRQRVRERETMKWDERPPVAQDLATAIIERDFDKMAILAWHVNGRRWSYAHMTHEKSIVHGFGLLLDIQREKVHRIVGIAQEIPA